MSEVPHVHRTQVRVRYAETDQMGVLHHSRYFVLLELARTEALRSLGLTYRELEEAGCYLVVAKVECTYRAPARYDDVLTIETRITRMTLTRIEHAYRILRDSDGTLVAEAKTTLASVDRDGTVQPMPDILTRHLKA